MTRDELAERYLTIAERLNGKELHQMLDRVEDLLAVSEYPSTNGAVPSGRTVVTEDGADVVYRNGKRAKLKRGEPAAPAVEPVGVPTKTGPRVRAEGRFLIRHTQTGRFYAEVYRDGTKHTKMCETREEAEEYLEGVMQRSSETGPDEIANLMNAVEPIGRVVFDIKQSDEASLPCVSMKEAAMRVLNANPSLPMDMRDVRPQVEQITGHAADENVLDKLYGVIARTDKRLMRTGPGLWALYAETAEAKCAV